MMMTYPALVYAATQAGGEFLVYFPDWGGRSIQATTLTAALATAQQVLVQRLQRRLQQRQPLPQRTPVARLSLVRDNPFKCCVDFQYARQSSFVTSISVSVHSRLTAIPIHRTA